MIMNFKPWVALIGGDASGSGDSTYGRVNVAWNSLDYSTTYTYNKINTTTSSGSYSLTMPSKSGILAVDEDIKVMTTITVPATFVTSKSADVELTNA